MLKSIRDAKNALDHHHRLLSLCGGRLMLRGGKIERKAQKLKLPHSVWSSLTKVDESTG